MNIPLDIFYLGKGLTVYFNAFQLTKPVLAISKNGLEEIALHSVGRDLFYQMFFSCQEQLGISVLSNIFLTCQTHTSCGPVAAKPEMPILSMSFSHLLSIHLLGCWEQDIMFLQKAFEMRKGLLTALELHFIYPVWYNEL